MLILDFVNLFLDEASKNSWGYAEFDWFLSVHLLILDQKKHKKNVWWTDSWD